jgi:hypothetical protein
MAVGNIIRRLRGALGNALVWGAGWFAAAVAVFAALGFVGSAHKSASWVVVLTTAIKFGVMGTIAGAAFSTFIGLRYHGRRLTEISWVRFGIGGGIVTGLWVPTFLVVARLLAGDDFLPLGALLANGAVGAVLGGAAAAVSLKLAQLEDTRLPSRSRDQADLLEGADRSAWAGERDARRRNAPARPRADD